MKITIERLDKPDPLCYVISDTGLMPFPLPLKEEFVYWDNFNIKSIHLEMADSTTIHSVIYWYTTTFMSQAKKINILIEDNQ